MQLIGRKFSVVELKLRLLLEGGVPADVVFLLSDERSTSAKCVIHSPSLVQGCQGNIFPVTWERVSFTILSSESVL